MPAADRCSVLTPPVPHVASLPYQLRDAREPPICSAIWLPRWQFDSTPNRAICVRLRWTKDADEILASIQRAKAKTNPFTRH
jgi:hypothetical protein